MTWRRFALLAGAGGALYYSLVATRLDLIAYADGVLRITDFAYYVVMVRAFWLDGHRSLYGAADHLVVMRELTGADLRAAMPLGSTPVVVFVYAPFVLLSRLSMAVAQSVWVGLSLAALTMMLARFQSEWAAVSRGNRLRWWLAVGITLGSFASLATLLLGQTSLAALAALGLIVQTCRSSRTVSRSVALLALLVVGLKPTYLVFALLILCAYRRWRLLLAALALAAASSAAFTVLSGPGWWRDYWRMLGMFSAADIPPEFRSAFALPKMNIFRSAWATWIPDATALMLTTVMALVGSAAAGAGLIRDLWTAEPPGSPRALSRCALLVGVYLLFAPYASAYEDLMLVLPVFLLLVARPERLSDWRMLPLLGALLVSCNALPLLSPATREMLWCVKVLACGLPILLLAGSPRSPTANADPSPPASRAHEP